MAFSTANNNKKFYLSGIVFLVVVLLISPNYSFAQTGTSLPQNFARSIFCTINNLLGKYSCGQEIISPNLNLVSDVSFVSVDDKPQPQIIQQITQPVIERTLHTQTTKIIETPYDHTTLKQDLLTTFTTQIETLRKEIYTNHNTPLETTVSNGTTPTPTPYGDTALWRAISQMNTGSAQSISSVNTDSQTLSIASNTLTITGGNSVSLAAYLDNTDTLSDLSCAGGEIAKWSGTAWACSADASGAGGTDDQTIDTFTLSSNTLSLSLEGDGEVAKTLDLSAYLDDTDTQLNETQVDAFVADNGYLTSETDDQTIDAFGFSGDTLTLSLEADGEAAKTVDLSTYAKDSDLHDAITLSGAFDYFTLVGQDIVRSAIDLASDITGTLSIGNGGTGATTTALARSNLGLAIGANVQAFDSGTSLLGQTIETAEITNGTILGIDLNLTDITLADFTNDQSFIADGNSNWDNSYGFLTDANDTVSGSELDGVFSATGLLTRTGVGTYGILTDSSANWNTAFGWGDHASGGYLTAITSQSIKNLSDVFSTMTPTDGQVLTFDTTNGWQAEVLPAGADDLGDHTATQTLNINGNYLSGDGDAEGLFVDGSGNVGIGTTTPNRKLTVDGHIRSLSDGGGSSNEGGEINLNYATDSGTGDWRIDAHDDATSGNILRFMDNSDVKMVIDQDSGRVGIGTPRPQAVLDVSTDIASESALFIRNINVGGYGALRIGASDRETNGDALLYNSPTNTGLRTPTTHPLTFEPAGAEAMRITSSGKVGIGTDSPSEELDVQGEILSRNLLLQGDGTDAYIRPQNAGSRLFLGAADVNYMMINETGNVGIGTTAPGQKLQVGTNGDGSVAIANAWNTFSDERWKKNIQILDGSLEKILRLDGVSYDWKNGGTTDNIGFIAQDLQVEFPQLVSEDSNGFLSVSYAKLVAPIVESIKEIWDKVSGNSDRITELESELCSKDNSYSWCDKGSSVSSNDNNDIQNDDGQSEDVDVEEKSTIDHIETGMDNVGSQPSQDDPKTHQNGVSEAEDEYIVVDNPNVGEDEEEPLELTATSTTPLLAEPDPIEQATSTIEQAVEDPSWDVSEQSSDTDPDDDGSEVQEEILAEPVEEEIEEDVPQDVEIVDEENIETVLPDPAIETVTPQDQS